MSEENSTSKYYIEQKEREERKRKERSLEDLEGIKDAIKRNTRWRRFQQWLSGLSLLFSLIISLLLWILSFNH
jgi:hypothetical protein